MSYNKIIEELIAENERLKEQNKTSYKPHEVFKLKQENTETKEIINNFREQNFELREDLGTYKNQYNKLFDENAQLKHEIDKQKNYNMSHAQRISELKKENTQLKKEIDDFYYEHSKLKETDFYIKALKNQLFNAYLEIESDNVNIQLSHYHIKKLLKIIDEHTLINPYTN